MNLRPKFLLFFVFACGMIPRADANTALWRIQLSSTDPKIRQKAADSLAQSGDASRETLTALAATITTVPAPVSSGAEDYDQTLQEAYAWGASYRALVKLAPSDPRTIKASFAVLDGNEHHFEVAATVREQLGAVKFPSAEAARFYLSEGDFTPSQRAIAAFLFAKEKGAPPEAVAAVTQFISELQASDTLSLEALAATASHLGGSKPVAEAIRVRLERALAERALVRSRSFIELLTGTPNEESRLRAVKENQANTDHYSLLRTLCESLVATEGTPVSADSAQLIQRAMVASKATGNDKHLGDMRAIFDKARGKPETPAFQKILALWRQHQELNDELNLSPAFKDIEEAHFLARLSEADRNELIAHIGGDSLETRMVRIREHHKQCETGLGKLNLDPED